MYTTIALLSLAGTTIAPAQPTPGDDPSGTRTYHGPASPTDTVTPNSGAAEDRPTEPPDASEATPPPADEIEAPAPSAPAQDAAPDEPEDDGFFVEDLTGDEEAAAEALGVETQKVAGPKGVITGVVRSATDGRPLIGATVEVPDTKFSAKTGVDGSFRLELPPGTYVVRIREDTHVPRVFEGVEIEADASEQLRVELVPMKGVGETVVVEAEVAKESEGARLAQRREAVETRDIMSREEIEKSGGGSTSTVARRIVGATVIDGKYLFVRGLGHRYGNTLLDRARVPSPEPDLRTIPLDVFPSAALSAINIQKTFTPDVPADFTGASTQLETRDVPDGWSFGVSASIGANTATTGRESVASVGFPEDALAFGNVPRRLPDVIPDDTRVNRNEVDENYRPIFSPEQIERFGESFFTVTKVDRKKGLPNFGAKLNFGYGGDVGKAGKLGFLLAATYGYQTQTLRGRLRQFGLGADEALVTQVDYDTLQTTRTAEWSTLGIVKWDVSDDHRVALDALYTRSGEDETRYFSGKAITVSGADPVITTRQRYIMRSILLTRLGGRHTFPKAKDFTLGWFGSYAQARRDDPHMREMLFTQANPDAPYRYDAGNDAGKITFLDLVDHTESGALDLSLPFRQWSGIEGKVQVGARVEGKQRTFGVRRFTYQVVGTLVDRIPDGTGNVINDATIGGGPGPGETQPFFIQETTRPNDNYRASNEIYAGYASLELPLVRWFKVAGGVRFEASDIDLSTFDPFDPDADEDSARLRDRDFFPSVSLIFSPTKRQNVRLTWTRTIARPEFRELAPFTFTDFVGGFDVQGNKFLRSTRVWNADLRWELFPSAAEVVAISAFYKYFDAPIERVAAPRIPPLASFLNADFAQAAGGELEVRKHLGFFAPRSKDDEAEARRARVRRVLSDFSIGANFAYVWSQVRLPEERTCEDADEACNFEQLFDVSTSRRRPLQGQSPFVLNVYLAYDRTESDTHVRLLFNTFGRYITQVSGLGLPDVYQEPVHALDLVFRQRLYDGLSLSLSGTNLLDWPIRWKQGDEIAREYRRGATFTLGLGWSL
ncbi:MAG: TonB-dependent receptor [Deltaproteobacteria bacterium]|nr:MAG: TonB-dependent receptor [Deltaproteobacteria bacterium]